MIYTDRQYEIYKYMRNNLYQIICEVYKDDGRLIAAVFKPRR